jgi:hypothetical protein
MEEDEVSRIMNRRMTTAAKIFASHRRGEELVSRK